MFALAIVNILEHFGKIIMFSFFRMTSSSCSP